MRDSKFDPAYGNWVEEEKEPNVVSCEYCGAELQQGDDAVELNGYIYCDDHCALVDIGAVDITIGEGDY